MTKTKPVATRLNKTQLAQIITALKKHNLPTDNISQCLKQALSLFVSQTDPTIPQMTPPPAALAEAIYLLEGRKTKPDFWSNSPTASTMPIEHQNLSPEQLFFQNYNFTSHLTTFEPEIQRKILNILSYLKSGDQSLCR